MLAKNIILWPRFIGYCISGFVSFLCTNYCVIAFFIARVEIVFIIVVAVYQENIVTRGYEMSKLRVD